MDSAKDNNKISFGIIKEIAIDDAQLLKTNVEEINERAIREGNISDELFERIRYSSDNNSRVGIERQLSKELSTDTGKSEYNQKGISRGDGNRGVYSGAEQSAAETKVKQKLSREIDQSDFEADIRYSRESATIEELQKENERLRKRLKDARRETKINPQAEFDEKSMNKFARGLLNSYNSTLEYIIKEVKKCLNLYWVPQAAVKHTI